MHDDDVRGWVQARLPDDWFTDPVEVTTDREEVLVRGRVAAPSDGADAASSAAAEEGRIARFREETRDARIAIARELEHRDGRKVAWAVDCGSTSTTFTSLSVPVMTRLRQPERRVLDTLIAAGVARSRSDALGWCVRLVGRNADAWLGELREAMTVVEEVRARGPETGTQG